jgi:hypothetical protein
MILVFLNLDVFSGRGSACLTCKIGNGVARSETGNSLNF